MAGWFKQYPPNTPVRQVANIKENNLIRAILDDLQGIGCRVIKPKGLMGQGWRIVVDGSSDVDPIPDSAVGTDTGQIPFKPYDREGWLANSALPSGIIVAIYSSDIPAGWVLCDGTNGTPDLRGRFIAGAKYGDTDFGGDFSTYRGAVSHSHSVDVSVDSAAPTEGFDIPPAGAYPAFITATASTEKHLPPFALVNFIMKL